VEDPANRGRLLKENRHLNVTEREEAKVIQYLVLGGHSRYTGLSTDRRPDAVMSSIHSGPGQLVFGYSNKQYCDLTMAFARKEEDEKSPRMQLHFHNYHGYPWHYKGHSANCPSGTNQYLSFELTPETQLSDDFKFRYAQAMTSVRPYNVSFTYSRSFACDWMHGQLLPSFNQSGSKEPKFFYNIVEQLAAERSDDFYDPPSVTQKYFDKKKLVQDIVAGRLDGFVTLRGGRERGEGSRKSPINNFGFCVQNYAPSRDQISQYTKEQIAEFHGLDEEGVSKYLSRQPARTLNSTTFHSEETISSAYLRWLVKKRNFCDFDITHFLWYRFDSHPREFIEPLLQRRHKLKQEGNIAAAEAIKLIVNSDYG
jgi:hypothetical protein